MSDITTTTKSVATRAPKRRVVLTDRMCEKRVTERVEIYDGRCSGLYVSITTAGVATFSFKFTDRETGQAAHRLAWHLQSGNLQGR